MFQRYTLRVKQLAGLPFAMTFEQIKAGDERNDTQMQIYTNTPTNYPAHSGYPTDDISHGARRSAEDWQKGLRSSIMFQKHTKLLLQGGVFISLEYGLVLQRRYRCQWCVRN